MVTMRNAAGYCAKKVCLRPTRFTPEGKLFGHALTSVLEVECSLFDVSNLGKGMG